MKIMRGGRARWLIENETFNTLKNLGYNLEHNYLEHNYLEHNYLEHNYLEHNYGHGEENLASNFACLMFLAFLIDQIVELACLLFNEALKANKRKKIFWEKQRNFFEICISVAYIVEVYRSVTRGKQAGSLIRHGLAPDLGKILNDNRQGTMGRLINQAGLLRQAGDGNDQHYP